MRGTPFLTTQQTARSPILPRTALKSTVFDPVFRMSEESGALSCGTGKPAPEHSAIIPLVGAVGLFTAGMLLHQLPVRTVPGVRFLLPTDWKVWGRVILGIITVNKVNKALDWQPPPWLGGMEAVSVITPLTMRFGPGTLKQLVLMAPVVAVVVQVASALNDWVTDPLKERFQIPRLVTRLGISLGLAAIGLKFSKMLGIGGAVAMTCARGCTPGSIVCLSEVGEMISGMKIGMQNGMTRWFQTDTRTTNLGKEVKLDER